MQFVVDLTNVAQVAEATMELYDMMAHPRTASKPLLLLLNKRDSAVRMSREFVDSSMRLEDLVATATQRITVSSALQRSSGRSSGRNRVLTRQGNRLSSPRRR